MWPIHLPKIQGSSERWINLANALEIVMAEPEPDQPLAIQITYTNGLKTVYTGLQAETILDALEEFHQPVCRYHEPIEEDA
jgi:hypothetical protein